MSFDFKLFFAYHVSMIGTSVVTGIAPITVLVILAVTLISVFSALSVANRRKRHWRWPGASTKNALQAIGVLAVGIFFAGSITPRVSVSDPRFFPWFAVSGGLILLGILASMRVVTMSEADFAAQCDDRTATQPEPARPDPAHPPEATWKRATRAAFLAYALALWASSVSYFWYFDIAVRDGSPVPTPNQTEAIVEHGRTAYITPDKMKRLSFLRLSLFPGGISVFVIGGLIHFVLGVKLVANVPTLREWTD